MENELFITYVIAFLAFIAFILLIEALFFFYRGMREEGTVKIRQRLKAISAGGGHGKEILDIIRRREFSTIPLLNRILLSIPRLHTLDRTLEQSGLKLSVSQFLGIQLALSVVFVVLLYFVANMNYLTALIIGVALGFIIPSLFVLKRRDWRHKQFTVQLPDAMDFIARSLRAGNPFSASLKAVSKEMPDPTGTEFGITFDEINYGIETEDALENLGTRSGSEEMNFFITAVLIQRQTGGNLADVLNRIATVMRDRAATYRDIRILSAEARLSAYILMALPFVVAGLIQLGNPGYLSILFDYRLGQMIIAAQIVLMVIGYMIMRRMINFRV